MALLELGANPKIRDKQGKAPWDYIQDTEALKDTQAYWTLNNRSFNQKV